MTREDSREPAKTPFDHLTDTLAQLKEMRHYSKTNVEHLTSIWMLFDGELSKLKRTDKIEDLMDRQSQLHDALEAVIADLEEELPKLQPAPDTSAAAVGPKDVPEKSTGAGRNARKTRAA